MVRHLLPNWCAQVYCDVPLEGGYLYPVLPLVGRARQWACASSRGPSRRTSDEQRKTFRMQQYSRLFCGSLGQTPGRCSVARIEVPFGTCRDLLSGPRKTSPRRMASSVAASAAAPFQGSDSGRRRQQRSRVRGEC